MKESESIDDINRERIKTPRIGYLCHTKHLKINKKWQSRRTHTSPVGKKQSPSPRCFLGEATLASSIVAVWYARKAYKEQIQQSKNRLRDGCPEKVIKNRKITQCGAPLALIDSAIIDDETIDTWLCAHGHEIPQTRKRKYSKRQSPRGTSRWDG